MKEYVLLFQDGSREVIECEGNETLIEYLVKHNVNMDHVKQIRQIKRGKEED